MNHQTRLCAFCLTVVSLFAAEYHECHEMRAARGRQEDAGQREPFNPLSGVFGQAAATLSATAVAPSLPFDPTKLIRW
jgi:hypothetical protein